MKKLGNTFTYICIVLGLILCSLMCVKKCKGQCGSNVSTPFKDARYDTTKGVIIWYENHLLVRADSAYQYRSAYTYITDNKCNVIPNYLMTYYYAPKLKMYIPIKQVIKFIEDEK